MEDPKQAEVKQLDQNKAKGTKRKEVRKKNLGEWEKRMEEYGANIMSFKDDTEKYKEVIRNEYNQILLQIETRKSDGRMQAINLAANILMQNSKITGQDFDFGEIEAEANKIMGYVYDGSFENNISKDELDKNLSFDILDVSSTTTPPPADYQVEKK